MGFKFVCMNECTYAFANHRMHARFHTLLMWKAKNCWAILCKVLYCGI